MAKINLKGRSLLTLLDFTQEEIEYLIDLSAKLKKDRKAGTEVKQLVGKRIALIFEKDSTRTRCAFEVAAFDQGAHVTYLGPVGSQIGTKESTEDTARVLGRMYDGIQYRGFAQGTAEELAQFAGVPVWNGLTDSDHPTQVLADLLTAKEHLNKPFEKMVIAYVGDGRNNVANALMIGCARMGVSLRIIAPKDLFPKQKYGEKTIITDNVAQGVKGVDIIYTDVWVSMGEDENIWEMRIKLLQAYQVNMQMLEATGNENVKFMHCLPAFHDTKTSVGKSVFQKYGLTAMEVTDEVFESKHSIVFDQAENRLHTIKAVMVATMK